MKNDVVVQYLVEGEDEKKIVNTLKNATRVIAPGKVQILNVIQNDASDMILRTFKAKTIVVLIFDTDTNKVDVLYKNIAKIQKYRNVAKVITIPQVKNLEDELVYSCNIKVITELLNSRSVSNFKSDLIHVTNLERKLKDHSFDISRFWSRQPSPPYENITNMSREIKIAP